MHCGVKNIVARFPHNHRTVRLESASEITFNEFAVEISFAGLAV